MKIKNIVMGAAIALALPAGAQILNFSIPTNNRQVIDKALAGAFVRIEQAYELCDTVSDEHFGRQGENYFSKIPFIGIETEQGLVFPVEAASPWSEDSDFKKYENKYKPILTETLLETLNGKEESTPRKLVAPLTGPAISEKLGLLPDSVIQCSGLLVDTVAGLKEGWLVWYSEASKNAPVDSLRFTSIFHEIEVPVDGTSVSIDTPEVTEKLYGGIYVTPIQTRIGQISFILSGIMVYNGDGWQMEFPFLRKPEEEVKKLTPISVKNKLPGIKPIKKKKK